MSESRFPQTVADVLGDVPTSDPGREALVTRSGRWTYAELDRLAAGAAAALYDMGVRPGDRVAACLPNDVDIVAAFHGAMRLGAVWVGINRALAPPEKAFALGDSGSCLLLCDDDTAGQIAGPRATLPDLREIVALDADGGPTWRAAVEAGAGHAGGGPPVAPVDPAAPAAIAYTSGTTGRPKGAVHSQRNLLLPGAAVVAARGYGPELRKGDCLPLTILNMLVLTTLLVSQAGGCSVIMDRIDAEGVAEWIRRERVTTWNGPPPLLYDLVRKAEVDPADLSSLDEVWSGGADCPESLREAFEAKFRLPVLGTYGLTEAPTIVAIDGRDGAHRAGASGRALPHLKVSVAGDAGGELPEGETGEICVAAVADGPWAGAYRPMLGYWRRPEPSDRTVRDGVLHTGDVGYLDADGFLYVRGRTNEVINRGGANVYPAEVERVLRDAPGVAACAVVGIPDERLGERVAAAVQLAPGAGATPDDLAARCGAELARYKVPERFLFVDSFPRNAMGKIERRSLRALFESA